MMADAAFPRAMKKPNAMLEPLTGEQADKNSHDTPALVQNLVQVK